MDRGYASCNGLAMAWALPLSVAVTITPAHGRLQGRDDVSAAQRIQACRAAARRRFVLQAAGWSTFVMCTAHMVRVAGCTLRSRARSHVTEDHPQPHRTAPSAHDVQQRALMRHHLATAARLPLLPQAQESTPATYCALPPHSFRWEALRKP